MKSVAIFVDYFGRWPDWFDVFLESCRANPTLDWYIHTDITPPPSPPTNVRFIRISFQDYCALVSRKLDVTFAPLKAYNICNVRPMIGVIYEEIISAYDYFGWGDIDVIYGDIRSIYTEDVLTHNVISAHEHTCSGHLTLVRNTPWLRTAFLKLNGWKARLEDPGPVSWNDCLDEAGLSALFSPQDGVREHFAARFAPNGLDPRLYNNNYFKEQWSTPFTPHEWLDERGPHPDVWFWRNGRLTNARDGDRPFLYLHFMNFKSPRWVDHRYYKDCLTWDRLDSCMNFTLAQLLALEDGRREIRIDRHGFHLLHGGEDAQRRVT